MRAGQTLTGYCSRDGIDYVEVGSATIALGKHVFLGLAATSRDPTAVCQAAFDEVTVSAPDPRAAAPALGGCEPSLLTVPGPSAEELLVR